VNNAGVAGGILNRENLLRRVRFLPIRYMVEFSDEAN
jgi:hypothetical protein